MKEVNFNNKNYKNFAINLTQTGNTHSPADAFLLLIKVDDSSNLTQKDLENLCLKLQQFYANNKPNPIELSVYECYKLIQSNNLDEFNKNLILNLAFECIKNGIPLGNNTIQNGKINTSTWISHCMFMSEVCANLAYALNLDPDIARTRGLLHDYGRKYSHKFDHTIIGFEKLCDLGWTDEALGCLTHSFVNGGRCSSNEQAVEGFYVDDEGNPCFKEGINKDDITLFLENYKYDEYDLLLNIGDLMATSNGVVAPHERIADIATRRIIDPVNRSYFLADLTNLLIKFLNKINANNYNFTEVKATKNISLEEIENYFNNVSNYFFNVYFQIEQKNKDNIQEKNNK